MLSALARARAKLYIGDEVLKTRIITGVVGMILLAGVFCFFDTVILNIACAALLLIAVHELTLAFKIEKPALLVAGLTPVILLAMFAPYLPISGGKLVWLCAFYVVLLVMVFMVFLYPKYDFSQLAGVLLFSALAFCEFFAIVWFQTSSVNSAVPYYGLLHTLLAMGAAWGGDTFAYFVGVTFGKHKLSPQLSPKKSVEGAFGALAGSVILNVFILWAYGNITGFVPARECFYYIIPVALAGSVLGMLGDLLASAVKRQCGIKDYGYILPGHGGVLDRFDSLLLVLPFYATVASFITLVF